MSRITAMRMLASNPKVLKESASNFAAENGKGSAYAYSLTEHLDGITKTPKLDATIKYLKEHLDIDPTYKAVIFSTFVGSAYEISQQLTSAGYGNELYTGRMNAKEKDAAKTKFQESASCRVLVSSDAGGYGVDLPNGNLLVNYDQPWSSGLLVQRNGRIVRASSEWQMVTIQDVLIKDSIEQRQWDMLRQKSSVAGAILDGEGINDKGGVELSVGSLITFLENKLG